MRQVRGWAYQDKRTAKDMQRADAQAEQGPHLRTTDNEQHDPAKPRRITDRVSWAVDRKTGAVDYKVDDRAAFRDSGRRLDYNAESYKNKDAIEAGLRQTGEAMRKQKEQKDKDREQAKMLNQSMDIDR